MTDGIIQKVIKDIIGRDNFEFTINDVDIIAIPIESIKEIQQELIEEIKKNTKEHGIFIMRLEQLIGDNE